MSLLKVNEIQIFNGNTVTITAPAVVAANDNTNAALRITQNGTGNALVVEDSPNPDSTPVVIDSSGNVGIGTTSPDAKLHVSGTSSSNGILVEDSSTSSPSPAVTLIGKRADTNSSQSFSGKLLLAGNRTGGAVASGKNIGTIAFGGNHSDGTLSNILYSSSISGVAEGDFSNSTTMPTGLAFYTGSTGRDLDTPNITVGTERMRIDSSGNVGIGTASPSQKLDVTGNINATGALTLGTALAIAEGGTGATDAATARTNLDVDQAGTDNSTDCTLVTTSHDYLSITGQAITLGPIDLAADVTGNLPYASISGTPTLATVATSGAYSDLSGTPTLGTAAAEDVGYFATAAQGSLADSAVQPGDNANTLGSGAATDGYVLTADGAGGAAWEAVSGGAASLPIDLLSSGASIRKSDGTTAVLSESGGAVTLENITNLEADSITDKLGTGPPDFPNGLSFDLSTEALGGLLKGYPIAAAWVTFDAGSDAGNNAAQTILDSFNVTSVTRSGTLTGKFVVNLSNTIDNANYSIAGTCNGDGSGSAQLCYDSAVGAMSTTSFGIRIITISGTSIDPDYVSIIVFAKGWS